MGKLEDRENRRRASVIGPIAGVEPETSGAKKGRPKEDRETKKRVSLSVLPSLYAVSYTHLTLPTNSLV